jgi:hypothetical protein
MRVAIASLEDAIEKLERENAEMRKYKERLKWLATQRCSPGDYPKGDVGVVVSENYAQVSLETAIDDARRKESAPEQANPAQGSTTARPADPRAMPTGKAYSLDEMQRTLELQADQIRELARVLHQHDMIRQRDLAQFEPRREGGAT